MQNNLNNGRNIRGEIVDIFSDFKNRYDTPVIVEVSGTPNSGKTTTIESLEKLLKRSIPLKIKVLDESASRCKIKDKLSPDFNRWTISETIRMLTEMTCRNYDLVICERGIFDALCWAQFHFNNGKITQEEFNTMSKYFCLPSLLDKIRVLILMKCKAETSILRENVHGIVDTKGTIVNEEVLSSLNLAIEQTYEKYKEIFIESEVLDTTNLSPNDINEKFLDILLKRLK